MAYKAKIPPINNNGINNGDNIQSQFQSIT